MIRVCIIAEHDPWEIRLLTVYADRLGLQTIQAFESQDVLPLARQEQPDVILLESSLPGALKSHEVLRALQSDDTTRDIPVVLLAWSPEEARRELTRLRCRLPSEAGDVRGICGRAGRGGRQSGPAGRDRWGVESNRHSKRDPFCGLKSLIRTIIKEDRHEQRKSLTTRVSGPDCFDVSRRYPGRLRPIYPGPYTRGTCRAGCHRSRPRRDRGPCACSARPFRQPLAATALPSAAEAPAKYKEAPALAELVKQGKLPPVEERLPEEPWVVEPLDERASTVANSPASSPTPRPT